LSHGFGTQAPAQQGLPTFGQAGPQGDTRTDDQKDINMADPSHQPKDTVADIQFHPQQTYAFAVATWDGKVTIYNISNTGQGQSIGMLKQYDVGAPALRLAFSSSNSNWLYCASGDGAIKIIDLTSGNVQPFAQHPGIFWLDVYSANGIEL
jgi:mRNA export factor